MNILNDWKLYVVLFSFIKDIALVSGIILVKFNDMKHLSEDFKNMKKEQKETNQTITQKLDSIFDRLGKIERDNAVVEAILQERFKDR